MPKKTIEPVLCACGTPIEPYIIGEHHYQASFCPACITIKEEEEAREAAESNVVRLGFQRRYANADFDNLHDPKPSPHAINACRLFATELKEQSETTGKGIYLWGPNGTGKTHLAVAITRVYGHALFVNTLHLFDAIKTSYNTGEPCGVYESAKKVPLLVLDDLGAERPTDWVQERLFALLSARWDEMLSTVYTSNLNPNTLPNVIGQRSTSRVLGSCLKILVDGPDHRQVASAAI